MKRSELTRRGFVKGGLIAAGTLMLGSTSALFGCASSAKTVEKGSEAVTHATEDISASDLVIEQSGFTPIDSTQFGADDNPVPVTEYEFVFLVTNATTGYVGKDVAFNVTGLDGDGNTVFTTGVSCPYLYPEIKTVVTGSATARFVAEGEQVVSNVYELLIEPEMTSAEWLETDLTKSDLENMFTISNVETEMGDSSIVVSATVLGNLEYANRVYRSADFEDTLEARAIAVFESEDGDLLFGSQSESLLLDQQTLDTIHDDPSYRNVSIYLPFAAKYADMQLYVLPGM